jgi:TonB family protein
MPILVALAAALAAAASADSTTAEAPLKSPPGWLKKPTPEELQAAFPADASRNRIAGKVELNCRVNIQGLTEDCHVVSETPPGMGFGGAALGMTPQLLFKPAIGAEGPVPSRVNIPISFKIAPTLLKQPTPDEVEAAWPADALKNGVGGKVELNCRVSVQGLAEDCQVVAESPPGKGFGGAALLLTPQLLFKPAIWAEGPVPARVNIPIKFEPSAPPFKTPPGWLKKPTPAEIKAAWPADALKNGQGGKVELNCRVNIAGLAEDCQVVSETPPGRGFGGAALLLTPQLLFKPAIGAAGPVPARVNIPVAFEASVPPQGPVLYDSYTMTRSAVWTQAPTFADVGRAYPKSGGGVRGYAAFRCRVKPEGGLAECQLIQEDPVGRGFGRAAKSLLPLFRYDVAHGGPTRGERLLLDVPIRLVDPASDEFSNRRIGEPIWLTTVDPNKVVALFPTQAIDKGYKAGRGIAHCVVAADGALTACTPGPAEPPDLGFSEAAVMVAGVMRMNRWSNSGGPIDGAAIDLPVQLKLGSRALTAAPAP